ncbi:MAG: hypothetical protein JW974_01840 [Alphaproteobacteria bacterium]|nr:hypothetical protein [Alphaproteobacteria bacterium]MBN2675521.1 hypothetical protein [Alphaproteobacteria bacterium]
MRLATVSVLSIFACFPAFADARLPVVNVAAGAVSARAAFGEAPLVTVSPVEKKVVSQRTSNLKVVTADVGEKIVASRSDILNPKKPSGDLWARSSAPLRLPEPQEFSVIKSDIELPEEDLEPRVVSRSAQSVGQIADMDSQIANLVDLQRKADESIRAAKTYKPSNINSYDIKTEVVSRNTRRFEMPETDIKSDIDDNISLSRVVVPMEEDVIVRKVKKDSQPSFASLETDFAKMSPGELKNAFKKTYLSENKHLSTYKIDDRFDVASDVSTSIEGFTSTRDLSESGGVRPLEIKIGFKGEDSSLSRDNYNLLSEYASVIVSNPKRAIQVSIPERSTRSLDDRKLAARRLAIVEQVLRDTGVSDQRIVPVLSQRSDDSFVLRVISSDQYETLTQQKRDMFGDSVSNKTYKSMTW